MKDIVNSVADDNDEISFEKAKQAIDAAIAQDPVAGSGLLGEFARAMKYYGLKSSKEFAVLRGYYAGKSAQYGRIIDFAGEQVLRGTANGESLSVGDLYTLIDGDAGNDTLEGGEGDDVYIFSKGDGEDRIFDANGLADEVRLGHESIDVVFERVNSSLRVRMPGSLDAITIDSWYNGDAYKIETFKSTDGNVITHTQIESLIQAMASFQNDTGMTWEQALSEQPSQVRSIVQEYWTVPTV